MSMVGGATLRGISTNATPTCGKPAITPGADPDRITTAGPQVNPQPLVIPDGTPVTGSNLVSRLQRKDR
jgi:hypothetical protein